MSILLSRTFISVSIIPDPNFRSVRRKGRVESGLVRYRTVSYGQYWSYIRVPHRPLHQSIPLLPLCHTVHDGLPVDWDVIQFFRPLQRSFSIVDSTRGFRSSRRRSTFSVQVRVNDPNRLAFVWLVLGLSSKKGPLVYSLSTDRKSNLAEQDEVHVNRVVGRFGERPWRLRPPFTFLSHLTHQICLSIQVRTSSRSSYSLGQVSIFSDPSYHLYLRGTRVLLSPFVVLSLPFLSCRFSGPELSTLVRTVSVYFLNTWPQFRKFDLLRSKWIISLPLLLWVKGPNSIVFPFSPSFTKHLLSSISQRVLFPQSLYPGTTVNPSPL